MFNRANFIAAIVIGAFVLSCAQNMMNGGNGGSGDGSTPDARADSMAETTMCCEPKAPVITKLWDGTLSPTARLSPDISTSAYREIIVYVAPPLNNNCPSRWQWRADASSPYGDINDSFLSVSRGRVPVSGSHVQLQLQGTDCTQHFVVAGVL